MGDERKVLDGMVGEWEGTYRVWVQPSAAHTECESTLHVEPVLKGQFVSGDYDWSAGATAESPNDGDPQSGSFMVGRTSHGEWQMAWVDSWHNGDSIMFCTGGPESKVTGTYSGGDQTWSWRTEFELPEPDHLVITAYNIAPDGQEAMATHGDYRRA